MSMLRLTWKISDSDLLVLLVLTIWTRILRVLCRGTGGIRENARIRDVDEVFVVVDVDVVGIFVVVDVEVAGINRSAMFQSWRWKGVDR